MPKKDDMTDDMTDGIKGGIKGGEKDNVEGQPDEKAAKKKIIRHMARGWYNQNRKAEKTGGKTEDRKQDYKEVKAEYLAIARKVFKFMAHRGVEMTLNKPADEDSDDG